MITIHEWCKNRRVAASTLWKRRPPCTCFHFVSSWNFHAALSLIKLSVGFLVMSIQLSFFKSFSKCSNAESSAVVFFVFCLFLNPQLPRSPPLIPLVVCPHLQMRVNNWQMCFALKACLVTDADAPFNLGSLPLSFPQVKSTYWRAVKACCSRTAGNSTSSWTLKGIVISRGVLFFSP